MEESTNYQAQPSNNYQFVPPKQPLPNATAILVLGILSIVLCICYGIIGLILGIIALYLGNKAVSMYHENPDAFDTASFNNAKAGRICAIIGVSLSALYIVVLIIYIVILGSVITQLPWENFR